MVDKINIVTIDISPPLPSGDAITVGVMERNGAVVGPCSGAATVVELEVP